MPSRAQSSRTRSRRQPSSDRIEEAPSQRSCTEDVQDGDADEREEDGTQVDEEQESQPRRSNRRQPKKTKTKATKTTSRKPIGASRQARSDDVDDDADEVPSEQYAPIDVDNFQNQPLARTDQMKIGGLAGDWGVVIRNIQLSALGLVSNVAESMAEAGLGDDRDAADKELLQIDIVMRELLDSQAELKAHQSSLDEIHQSMARGDVVADVLERYENGAMKRVEEWKALTSRQRYAKDEHYLQFKQGIFNVQHPDEAMPPTVELIPMEDGDESDDEDLVIGGVTQDFKCPLSLVIMENPLTSSVCGHSFSDTAIMQFLGTNRSTKKQCPASGCSKLVGISDFKPDKDLERRVKSYVRRLKRAEAEADSGGDDDDDVIE